MWYMISQNVAKELSNIVKQLKDGCIHNFLEKTKKQSLSKVLLGLR